MRSLAETPDIKISLQSWEYCCESIVKEDINVLIFLLVQGRHQLLLFIQKGTTVEKLTWFQKKLVLGLFSYIPRVKSSFFNIEIGYGLCGRGDSLCSYGIRMHMINFSQIFVWCTLSESYYDANY